MSSEVSSGLIVRDDKILLVFDSEQEHWDVPSVNVSGRICADAAREATENLTGCECDVHRYEKKLKTRFSMGGEEYIWQPYLMDLAGEPEEGEWVPLDELGSRQLSPPLDIMKEKMIDRL